jgi:3-hydroxyacyl-[acyl-carrier-protein] dehydratase
VPKNPPIIDLSQVDLNNIVADIEEIRKYLPQRYEMEHLTAVCVEDTETNICVGYRDITDQEFWVRGHMPGYPIMPGVIMCEAAAQLASYYGTKHKVVEGKMIAYAGLDKVSFRGMVRPGDRFVIMTRPIKVRRVLFTCEFQCYVGEDRVAEGVLKGAVMNEEQLGGDLPFLKSD